MMQNDDDATRVQANSQPKTEWQAIYHRLENTQQRIDHGDAVTPEQSRALLKARAKQMAQPPPSHKDASTTVEIVQFRMAHETYAFESRYIREVYPLRDYCPLPCTPAFVFGLINVRGQLLSVLDLKRFFGLASRELDNHNQAIILRHEWEQEEGELYAPQQEDHSNLSQGLMEVGILADALLDVREVPRASLQSALPTLTGLRQEFLLGITPDGVIVLDGAKLLASREIIIHEEVEI